MAVLRNCTGTKCERTRKDITKLFQQAGLKITTQTNLRKVDYLDVTMDLTNGRHTPYRKPNDTPLYINVLSNHPKPVISQIPGAISKRLSTLSSDQDAFNSSANEYNEALRKSGYKDEIRFKKDSHTHADKTRKNNRKRKVIWFNPPFSKSVKSNVGGNFLKLIDKHFPPNHKLHKIFNRNSIKISYSCMPNISTIIKSHNRKLTSKTPTIAEKSGKECNCRKPEECPMSGKCLSSQIVYKATVKSEASSVLYVGLAGGTFKERFSNHKKAMNNERYSKETELSKHIWGLKKGNRDYEVTWSILRESNTHRRASGQCNLCLDEKVEILKLSGPNMLNKRTEIISKCRHGEKPANRAKKR